MELSVFYEWFTKGPDGEICFGFTPRYHGPYGLRIMPRHIFSFKRVLNMTENAG